MVVVFVMTTTMMTMSDSDGVVVVLIMVTIRRRIMFVTPHSCPIPVIVKSYDLYATDGRVARGDTALIQCVIPDAVSSYVRVEEWHQREGDLDSRYSIMPTGDLLISKVDMKDENQMFFCTAINLLTGDLQASNPAKIFVEQGTTAATAYNTMLLLLITISGTCA